MLSVSDIATFEYCKRKLFLTRVFNLREIAKAPALRGIFIHNFYKQRADLEKEIVTSIEEPDIEKIKTTYRDRYHQIMENLIKERLEWLKKNNLDIDEIRATINRSINYEITLRAKNVFNNMIETGAKGDELWKRLSPKIWSEQRIISPILQLKGVVDLIKESEKEIIPIELKTGSAPDDHAWPNHNLQLSAYMLMLADTKRKDVNRGIIRYIDHDKEFTIMLNPFLKEDILKRLDSIDVCLKGDLPDFTANKNKCKVCGLRSVCYDEKKMDNIQRVLLKKR